MKYIVKQTYLSKEVNIIGKSCHMDFVIVETLKISQSSCYWLSYGKTHNDTNDWSSYWQNWINYPTKLHVLRRQNVFHYKYPSSWADCISQPCIYSDSWCHCFSSLSHLQSSHGQHLRLTMSPKSIMETYYCIIPTHF